MHHPPLRFFAEVLGLSPLPLRLQQALIALRGQEDVPPSRFDLTSLRQLHPRVAPTLWRGRPYLPRRVLLTNLFNHRQTPIEEGWSVKVTQVEDFRGRRLTYDSHNGTDFTIPVGTPVLAAAPGEVVLVLSEFNRGGLKIFIDHGHGLMTCCAHLARPLVRVGQRVGRAQPIALSGYSGLDGFTTFPWGVPHVHFNTWLDGDPVDPFPHHGQASMWRAGDLPLPTPAGQDDGLSDFTPSVYDPQRVAQGIDACVTASSRQRLTAIEPLHLRAASLITEMNYYPTRFPQRITPYRDAHPRVPCLDLPFPADRFDGVTFLDDL